jgi:hypothetical protein
MKLLAALAASGARDSSGNPVSSGFVFLYARGTTTLVPGYTSNDGSATWPTTGGAIQLDAGGRAAIWVNQPIDVVVALATGGTVATWLDYAGTPANMVEVANAGFTGTITDAVTGLQTQGAGGIIDGDTVLTRAKSSFGGNDWQYLESAGATPRNYQDIVRLISISPQDFGAKGDGLNDDTAAIVSAITELTRLKGGKLYFPPGTYKVTSSISLGSILANATGISFEGAGSDATNILCVGASAGFFVYGTGCRMKGFSMSGGTGSAIDIQNGIRVALEDIVTSTDFQNGLVLGATSYFSARNCTFGAFGTGTNVAVQIQGSCAHLLFSRVNLAGAAYGMEWNFYGSGSGDALFESITFASTLAGGINSNGDPFSGPYLGRGVTMIGSPTLGALTTPWVAFSVVPLDLIQLGNELEGATTDILTGASVTPTPEKTGKVQRFKGTTTGSAYSVAVPAYNPVIRGWQFQLVLVNAAGGAVTGWTLAAGYKTTAAVPTTDAHTITLTFERDVDTTSWREVSRTDTAT